MASPVLQQCDGNDKAMETSESIFPDHMSKNELQCTGVAENTFSEFGIHS